MSLTKGHTRNDASERCVELRELMRTLVNTVYSKKEGFATKAVQRTQRRSTKDTDRERSMKSGGSTLRVSHQSIRFSTPESHNKERSFLDFFLHNCDMPLTSFSPQCYIPHTFVKAEVSLEDCELRCPDLYRSFISRVGKPQLRSTPKLPKSLEYCVAMTTTLLSLMTRAS